MYFSMIGHLNTPAAFIVYFTATRGESSLYDYLLSLR